MCTHTFLCMRARVYVCVCVCHLYTNMYVCAGVKGVAV